MMVMFANSVASMFRDRQDAGRRLGRRLERMREQRPVVVGLARGGVPVAFEVARALGAPLDVVVVRKLGAPIQPELGIGAIGEGSVRVLNEELVRALAVEPDELEAIAAREQAELERRQRLYRGDRPPVPLAGRLVVLVDDGIATGVSAVTAARVLRARGAARVVLAVPVGPPGAAERLADEVDQLICLESPEGFFAVGAHYERFGQTGDDEVVRLLERGRAEIEDERTVPVETHAADRPRVAGGIDWSRVRHRQVQIPAGEVELSGDLRLPPPAAAGLVIFAHGSGSGRLSPRNVQVAAALNAAGLATLLFDLLTEREAADRTNVFDIRFLAERLVAATRWAQQDSELQALPIGYFGASTGAAAALWAAAELGPEIRAVVSRGGRPDLAGERLADVSAATLLIVGGADRGVIELNEQALAALRCAKELVLVPDATHLFPEPGALEQVAARAAHWFAGHLGSPAAPGPEQEGGRRVRQQRHRTRPEP